MESVGTSGAGAPEDYQPAPPLLADAQRIARVGFWSWEVGAEDFRWSRELFRIAGRDPESFRPTFESTFGIFHPEDKDRAVQRLTQALSDHEPYEFEFRALHADGEERVCWTKVQPVVASGVVTAVHGICLDITERRRAEEALRESDEHHRYTIELNPQIPWTADAGGALIEISPRWCAITGMDRDAVLGSGWLAALHPADAEPTRAAWQNSLMTGAPVDLRYRLRMKDGGYRWFRARAGARRDNGGAIMRWYGLLEDIDDQTRAECAVRVAEERYRLATGATNDLIWEWDLATGKLDWNTSLGTRFGYGAHELGRTSAWFRDCIHPDDRCKAMAEVARALASDAAQFGAEYRFRRADGSFAHVAARGYIIRDENGCALRTVGAIQDLTERRRAEEKIRWSATHDPLTELPNRLLFQERLAGAIHSAHASGTKLALLHLDLDHFKQVNDAIGHDAGDLLLKTFAQRLREVVRAGDTVARLGGDEFAVILRGVRTEAELTPLVASILERIKEPFVYASRILDCRASIGASLYPEHGADPDELLRNADAALYMAKAGARGGLELFRQSMRAELQKRESMVSIARDAVRNERIVPFYQPKIELRTGTHSGLEALLRWRHPGRGGIQLPATISAAFEDLDVAAEISDRMIAAAIVDMRRWLDAGIDFGHVAVNASAAEFRRGDFGESVLERLSQAGVPTRYFQLEVTETVFLGRGAEHVESALKLLSMSGVRIALDDFGTGYASLRHLKQFPVDVIKIDRSFVAGMEEEPDSFAIVRAVINLGRSLNIEVVAEGVETPDQCRRLQSLGCDYGQGFLFSRPRCAEQIAGFIATWSPDALAAQTRPPVPAAGGGTLTWMNGWRPGERRLTL